MNMNDVPLEGDITLPKLFEEDQEDELSTLDEPVKDTIVRYSYVYFSCKNEGNFPKVACIHLKVSHR